MARRRRLTLEQRAKREAEAIAKEVAENARRAEYDRLEAIRYERIAEDASPSIMRRAIVQERFGSDGVVIETVMLRGPLVEVVNGRPQRVNHVLPLYGQKGEISPADQSRFRDIVGALADRSPCITAAHLTAARRLQADWAEVGGGIGVKAVDYAEWTPGLGGSNGIDVSILSQIATRARLDGALAWLRTLRGVVAAVVLDCVPVNAWAAANGMREPHAVGYLAAALTRLVEFYEQPSERAATIYDLNLAPAGGSGDASQDSIRSLVDSDVANRTLALGKRA